MPVLGFSTLCLRCERFQVYLDLSYLPEDWRVGELRLILLYEPIMNHVSGVLSPPLHGGQLTQMG